MPHYEVKEREAPKSLAKVQRKTRRWKNEKSSDLLVALSKIVL